MRKCRAWPYGNTGPRRSSKRKLRSFCSRSRSIRSCWRRWMLEALASIFYWKTRSFFDEKLVFWVGIQVSVEDLSLFEQAFMWSSSRRNWHKPSNSVCGMRQRFGMNVHRSRGYFLQTMIRNGFASADEACHTLIRSRCRPERCTYGADRSVLSGRIEAAARSHRRTRGRDAETWLRAL